MKPKDVTAEYRLSKWAQIIQERGSTGESIKEFCQNRGIKRHSYFYWQRKLREAASDSLAIINAGTKQSAVPFGFTELKLTTNQKQVRHDDAASQGQLHVEIRGVRMSADSTYPADKLAYLLRELVSQC
jgi:transposase-like protein